MYDALLWVKLELDVVHESKQFRSELCMQVRAPLLDDVRSRRRLHDFDKPTPRFIRRIGEAQGFDVMGFVVLRRERTDAVW